MNELALPAPSRCPVNFDQHGAEHVQNWPDVYRELRADCPRSWVDRYDGFWLATRYKDILAISQRTDAISVVKTVDPDSGKEVGGASIPTVQGARSIPNELDSPEWDAVRSFLTKRFSPKAALNLRARTEQLVNSLLDNVAGAGRIDFVEDLTNPLPAMITVEILGFPLHEWKAFSEPVHTFFSVPRDDPRIAQAAAGIEYFRQRVDEEIAIRRSNPTDDLLSYFAQGSINGEPLPQDLIQDLSWQIMSGGVDTTGSASANAFLYLGRNPDKRRWLVDNPQRIPLACEEFIRYFTPIQGAARNLTRDLVVDDWHMLGGQRVQLAYASGNRDPEIFDDPEEVKLDRSPNRHLGFGAGQHRCLGAFLARMMFECVLDQFLKRIPEYTLDEERVAHYPSVGFVNGLTHLPASFVPRHR
jgi:cytochrome P450